MSVDATPFLAVPLVCCAGACTRFEEDLVGGLLVPDLHAGVAGVGEAVIGSGARPRSRLPLAELRC